MVTIMQLVKANELPEGVPVNTMDVVESMATDYCYMFGVESAEQAKQRGEIGDVFLEKVKEAANSLTQLD